MFRITKFKLGVTLIVGVVAVLSVVGISTFVNAMSSKRVEGARPSYTVDLDGGEKWVILPRKDATVEMHEMANNYVVASTIWVTKEMTQKRIDELIVEVNSDESAIIAEHKTRLLEILSSWKDGDFTNLAADHNYVWGALDGTVGRASGVKGKEDLPAWSI
ncbi:MAG TPA: DUF6241 domain-containing protein [Desulfosporosinus sp.]|nr:DUF6241 domain-containing protein [Desulfosporosinus sp.]